MDGSATTGIGRVARRRADAPRSRAPLALAIALAAAVGTLAGERLDAPVADRLAALVAPATPDDIAVLALTAAEAADETRLAAVVAGLADAGVAAVGIDLPHAPQSAAVAAAAAVGAVPVVVAAAWGGDLPAAVRTGVPLDRAEALPSRGPRPPFALALADAAGGAAVLPAGRIVFGDRPIRAVPPSPLLWPLRLRGATVIVGDRDDRIAVPPGTPGADRGSLQRAQIDAHVVAQIRAARERRALASFAPALGAGLGAAAGALLPRGGAFAAALVAVPLLWLAAVAASLVATAATLPALSPLLAFATAAGALAVLRRAEDAAPRSFAAAAVVAVAEPDATAAQACAGSLQAAGARRIAVRPDGVAALFAAVGTVPPAAAAVAASRSLGPRAGIGIAVGTAVAAGEAIMGDAAEDARALAAASRRHGLGVLLTADAALMAGVPARTAGRVAAPVRAPVAAVEATLRHDAEHAAAMAGVAAHPEASARLRTLAALRPGDRLVALQAHRLAAGGDDPL